VSGTYRIIVCLDVPADSHAEAYRKASDLMNASPAIQSGAIAWESSDEAYDPNGDPISHEEMSATFAAPAEVCDECGAEIPDSASSVINEHHKTSCSAYSGNVK